MFGAVDSALAPHTEVAHSTINANNYLCNRQSPGSLKDGEAANSTAQRICHLTWEKGSYGCDLANDFKVGNYSGRPNIISRFLIRQRRMLEEVTGAKTSRSQ